VGASWIVAAGATAAWAGKANQIASWTVGGWRFIDPVSGMIAWNKAIGCWIHWSGMAWSDGSLPAAGIEIDGVQVVGQRQPDVPSPSGGTTIDVEARTAIAGVLATLKSHGLID
jgi:hypothetical protein